MNMLGSISQRIEKIEGSNSVEAIEKKIEETVEKKVAEYMEEVTEKEKRKMNMVIVNLTESDEDTSAGRMKEDLERVRMLMGKIPDVDPSEIENPIRLGKQNIGNNGKPRMLRVTVKTMGTKDKIMKGRFELTKGTTDSKKRLYINQDFTAKERLEQKALRDERTRRIEEGETDLVIRNGKIVKWQPNTKQTSDAGRSPGEPSSERNETEASQSQKEK